jgi:prevent-host-death family protein
MAPVHHKGAEEARNQLPALLAEAAKGRATLITRHGRSVAAIVPATELAGGARQKPLTSLSGSGRGLWGKASIRTVRRLREEWGR